jgi:hypothetical protein
LGVEGFAGLFSADTGALLSVFFGVKPLLSVFVGVDFRFLLLLLLLLVEVLAEGSAGVANVWSCPKELPLFSANKGALFVPLLSVFFVGDSRVLPVLLLLLELLLLVEIVRSLEVRPARWPDTDFETDTATGVKLPRLCHSDFREETLSVEKVAFRDETPEVEFLLWEGAAEKGFGKNCEKPAMAKHCQKGLLQHVTEDCNLALFLTCNNSIGEILK